MPAGCVALHDLNGRPRPGAGLFARTEEMGLDLKGTDPLIRRVEHAG